mmetsp:Transcript_69360/g.119179  ORF Transcript_69360/g.119179 Transcript_69360/m.119179 type:complete len:424 (+) Transcript_69360:83-1354(+)
MATTDLDSALNQLSDDVSSLWCPRSVPRLATPPDAANFCKFVVSSTPVVISHAIDNWPALTKWTLPYLSEHCSNPITVNVTPDGLGDAVKAVVEAGGARLFVKPEERVMDFSEFSRALENPATFSGVPYVSLQNDSLRAEFAEVAKDVPCLQPGAPKEVGLGFATAAFGGSGAEAVNLWVGDDRSVSSCHQDFYENIYCVLQGTKRFTLFPPSDCAFLNEQPFRSAKHVFRPAEGTEAGVQPIKTEDRRRDHPKEKDEGGNRGESDRSAGSGGSSDGGWSIEVEGDEHVVNWVDAARADLFTWKSSAAHAGGLSGGSCGRMIDQSSLASPLVVEVHAGEVLYLPAMWYHQVEQCGITVAVNFWHDMNFKGPTFSLLSFIRNLTVAPPSAAAAQAREMAEMSNSRKQQNEAKASKTVSTAKPDG